MRTSEPMSPPCAISPASRRAELERFAAQVAEWTALIGQYRASARRGEPRTWLELDRIIDELQRCRNEASARVMRLKGAAGSEWEHEKVGLEQTWKAVWSSFRKAQARF